MNSLVEPQQESLEAPRNGILPVSRREILLVLAGWLLLVAVELTVANGWSLFQRLFWLDEIYTHTIVADEDFGHSMRALQEGAETNSPLLHVLLRCWSMFTGPTEVAFRLFALGSVTVAVT